MSDLLMGIDFNDPHLAEDMKPPPCVYHYTDAEGLAGIIKDGVRVRATHHRFLNDAGELKFGLSLFNRVVEQLLDDDQLIQRVKEEVCQATENEFVASFSRYHSVLSQWRAYAQGGRGYCLGLRPAERLVGYGDDEYHSGDHLVECLYGEEEVDKSVRESCQRKVAKYGTNSEYLLRNLVGVGRRYAYVAKHEHFREEQEWRLVVSSSEPNDVSYRPSARGLVPHLLSETLHLEEVWVGPGIGPDRSTAVEVTRQFLKKNELEAKVEYWESSFVGK